MQLRKTKATSRQQLKWLGSRGMQQGPVQVTVIEYVNEFFKNYSKRAYGKTLLGNASKGAETLMGECTCTTAHCPGA